MNCNFFQLCFFKKKEKGIFAISPYPLLDFTYQQDCDEVIIFTPPLPLVLTQYLWQQTQKRNWWQKMFLLKGFAPSFSEGLAKIKKITQALKIELDYQSLKQGEELPAKEKIEEALSILEGRCLWEGEVERALRERKFSALADWEKVVHCLSLEGKAIRQRGISEQGQCQRCGGGELEKRDCYLGGQHSCFVCTTCFSMGQGRSCSLLYSFSSLRKGKKAETPLKLDFPLTPPQRDASFQLQHFLQQKEKEFLLWAVCGAGKTEVVYEAIRKVLSQGEKVLLAIPRQEVVRELLPRLQQAFPQTKIAALFGGQREKYSSAQLIIATTHQTIRFFQHFALIVLDEVDAYPYPNNQMLQYGVKRACKPQGKIIYLTATPQGEQLGLPTITIPARHHGCPLPEPKILALPLPREIEKYGLPEEILNFLQESIEKDGCQVFIFLPTIKLTTIVGKWLKDYYLRTKGIDWVEYSHSKDTERIKKKENFSRGLFPLLVTTTIMERGVTIPRLNVLVLHSDQEKIFNTAALIQMAGRAGRKKEYPEGRVLFVGQTISSSMQEAQKIIHSFNQEARQKGYLFSNSN